MDEIFFYLICFGMANLFCFLCSVLIVFLVFVSDPL